jgi:hypothetical protein
MAIAVSPPCELATHGTLRIEQEWNRFIDNIILFDYDFINHLVVNDEPIHSRVNCNLRKRHKEMQ